MVASTWKQLNMIKDVRIFSSSRDTKCCAYGMMKYLKTPQLYGMKGYEVSYLVHRLYKDKIKNHWTKDEPETFEDEQDEFLFDGG